MSTNIHFRPNRTSNSVSGRTGGMDSLMYSSNKNNNPQNMNSSTTAVFPSSPIPKAATCSLQQQLNPNPNLAMNGHGTLMFTTASATVRKKCGSGMTRYNQSNYSATPRTHPNILYDCNPYNYYSGLSQASLLECLSIATPTTTAATVTATTAATNACKKRHPALDNNTSNSKKPKRTNGTTADKSAISIIVANTSASVLEVVGATASRHRTQDNHATPPTQPHTLEINNSITLAVASGNSLESVRTLNATSTTPNVQQRQRLSSPNRNIKTVESLSQLLLEPSTQQRHLENVLPLPPLRVTHDVSEPSWKLTAQSPPQFLKETLSQKDLHVSGDNVEKSSRNGDDEQPTDLSNDVTAVRSRAGNCGMASEQRRENNGNLHNLSPNVTITITAVQEQVQNSEIFSVQHTENSREIHERSTRMSNTKDNFIEEAIFFFNNELTTVHQDECSKVQAAVDKEDGQAVNLWSSKQGAKLNVADLDSFVAGKAAINHLTMQQDIGVPLEMSTSTPSNASAKQKLLANCGEPISSSTKGIIRISPAKAHEAAENIIAQREIPLLIQNPTDTKQHGYENYDAAIIPCSGQPCEPAQQVTMEQQLPLLPINVTKNSQYQIPTGDKNSFISTQHGFELFATIVGKDGDKNIESKQTRGANQAWEHPDVELSIPSFRGSELDIINSHAKEDASPSPSPDIPLEQSMNIEVFIQNFTRNFRESQDLHPYMVTDSRCHKCAKRCPRVISFGCKYATHRLCGKHVEMLLGLNIDDVTASSSKVDYCPICCFKCSCSLCKNKLQKLWSEHCRKNNSNLVSHSLIGDVDLIDESLLLISGNENVELDLSVLGITKQHDTANLSCIEADGNNGKCLPPAKYDPLIFCCRGDKNKVQGLDKELLIMDTGFNVKEVQNSSLEKNVFSINDIIFNNAAEMHPVSHSTFVELINREKKNYLTCPTIDRNKQCHICHKRHSEVASFGCRFSNHAYCKKHVERHLGLNFNLQELQSKCNFCPICSLQCSCNSCKRAIDKLWNEYKKYVEEQKHHKVPIAVDQDNVASSKTRIKLNTLEWAKNSNSGDHSDARNTDGRATEDEAPKGTTHLGLDAPIPNFFSIKDDFVEEMKLMNRRRQKFTPTITHNQICHICHLRRPTSINFGCDFDIRHAFCERHAKSRLGMENLSLQAIKSKLKHCPICCFECECAKCHRKVNQLWAQQKANQNTTLPEYHSQSEKKSVSKVQDGKLIKSSAKDFVEESTRLKEPQSKKLRSAYLVDLKRLKQEHEKIHPCVLTNFNCHICKKRASSAIHFGCVVGDKHALCERHVKKWFGAENLNLQEIALKLNYCPICCFECECAKCLRQLDSIWEDKIEVSTPEITMDRCVGISDPAMSNISTGRSTDSSKFKRLASERSNDRNSVDVEVSAEALTLEASSGKDPESVTQEANMCPTGDTFHKQSQPATSEIPLKRASKNDKETIEDSSSKAVSNFESENDKIQTKSMPLGTSSYNSDYEIPLGFSPLTGLGVCGVEQTETCNSRGMFCDLNSTAVDEDLHEQYTTSFKRPKNMKKCPFLGKSHVNWYCCRCQERHWVETRNALHPFSKKHGYRFEHVEEDGDCFFTCIHKALRSDSEYLKQLNSYRQRTGMKEFSSFPSIATLRELVAGAIGEEQLAFYQMQAIAHPNEPWLECFRVSSRDIKGCNAGNNDGQHMNIKSQEEKSADEGFNYRLTAKPISISREKRNIKTRQVTAIRTVDELKRFVLRLGSEYGAQYTFWADSFAQKVIADLLNITILFVDMERDRNCWPYRVLAKGVAQTFLDLPQSDVDTGATGRSSGDNGVRLSDSFRYIVLQRQGHGHFILLSYQEKVYGEKLRSFKADKLPPAVAALWSL